MGKKRVSITVEQGLLAEFKLLGGSSVNLSAIMSKELQREVKRLQLLALLDEMEAESPMTPAGRAAGERLWEAMNAAPHRKRRVATR
jgi:hypothetical protein